MRRHRLETEPMLLRHPARSRSDRSGTSACAAEPPVHPRGPAHLSLRSQLVPLSPHLGPRGAEPQLRIGKDDAYEIAGRKQRGSRGGRPPGLGQTVYAGRNVVERQFGPAEQWRGIATRYDKHAITCRDRCRPLRRHRLATPIGDSA